MGPLVASHAGLHCQFDAKNRQISFANRVKVAIFEALLQGEISTAVRTHGVDLRQHLILILFPASVCHSLLCCLAFLTAPIKALYPSPLKSVIAAAVSANAASEMPQR